MMVLLLVLAVLVFPRENPPRHHIPCWAEPCRAYARALAASINSSRDPCDDFYLYVCDRWQPQFGGRSVLEDSALAFRSNVRGRAATAKPSRTSQDSYEKAAMLYKSCLAKQTTGVAEFKQFLRDRQLPWPNVDTRVSFLDVALDLSFNWHFPLLFYVYRLSAPAQSEHGSAENSAQRLVFTDDFLGQGPRALLEERGLRESNAAHICSLRDVLKEGGDRESGTSSCEYLDALQQRILGALISGKTHEREDDSWTQYENLESFASDLTSSVSGERWVTLIKKHSSDAKNLSVATPVDVRNRPHMRRLGSLLRTADPTSLLQLAGLCVVQGLGRFASQQLATLIYGDVSSRAQRHPELCYKFVDHVMPRLLSSRQVALTLDNERVEKANEVFDAVQSSIGASVRSAAWLDEGARPLAFKTVNLARLDYEAILTGQAEGVDLASHAIAAILPDFCDDFLDNLSLIPQKYWEEIHRGLTPATTAVALGGKSPWAFRDLTDTLWADVWRQHDASPFAPHTAVLPNLYMLESLFPPDAYESVNYGVVGSLLTRQLLTATIWAERRKGWPFPAPSVGGKNDSLHCIQEAFYDEAPHSAAVKEDLNYSTAMFVAAASLKPLYKALFNSAGYPDWSTGFEQYTANQLFFLALCFPSCGLQENRTGSQDEPSRSSWCNVPLRLFDSFSKAFECSHGKGMSAREACTVW
ncbi:hypothetical protein V5799_010267 [Amblyomma americanum]|uniref:Peptidase M13 N-terminal domain-containing protein n=1 Tax=Amblyomma americanum TaxID=6943 RepID=A0AAQ4F9R1_AMBAM